MRGESSRWIWRCARRWKLYPEITQGPEIDGTFVVSLNLRADGTVLGNTLAIANSVDEVNTLSHEMKAPDASRTFTSKRKGARQEDGAALRGHLSVNYSVVSNSFDLSRASPRVEEIIRAERSHLMMPAKGGMNTLTVLLSEDGAIQRENVEFVGVQGQQSQGKKPAAAEDRAKEMARKLGVGVEQIGVMGTARINNSASDRANPAYLMIEYAWQRRPGEVTSINGQDENFLRGGVDEDAALAVIERVMPEAFLQTDLASSGPSTNAPAIAFTADGRVVGVGRINLQSGEPASQQVEKFAPGVRIYSGRGVSVRNAAGRSAEVNFFWEATPAQKEELAKAERTRSGG